VHAREGGERAAGSKAVRGNVKHAVVAAGLLARLRVFESSYLNLLNIFGPLVA